MNDPGRLASIVEAVFTASITGPDSSSGSVSSPASGPERRQLEFLTRRRGPLLSDAEVDEVVRAVIDRRSGLGMLQRWLEDPDISEIMVNAGREVWVERSGRVMLVGHTTPAETARVLERVVAPLGLRVDRSSPVVEARLADGARVHGAIEPIAVDGPCITVRRFRPAVIAVDEFGAPEMAAALAQAVRDRRNIVVSGGTGSGKTTFLNALSAVIADDERVITIEDSAELRLQCRHVVRLEARVASAEGVGAVTIRDLVRASLRMRPDRIVIGEVRGAEALDMISALNTGHSGSLTTVHANSALDALRRIETLALYGDADLPLMALRRQVGAAIDVVVHLERTAGGIRQIREVCEVGASGRDVVPIDPDGGALMWMRPARWAS